MSERIPSRLSARAVARYEQHINAICAAWPGPVVFEPHGSIDTFSNRLRDAIRAQTRHHWSETIDPKFYEVKDQIVVATRDGRVVAGSRAALSNKSTPTEATQTGTVENPGTSVVRAYALLMHHRLHGPVMFDKVSQDVEAVLNSLDEEYDISIEYQNDGKILML